MLLPILRIVKPLPARLAAMSSDSMHYSSLSCVDLIWTSCLSSSAVSKELKRPMHTMYGIVCRACLPPCVQRLE